MSVYCLFFSQYIPTRTLILRVLRLKSKRICARVFVRVNCTRSVLNRMERRRRRKKKLAIKERIIVFYIFAVRPSITL